MSRKTDVSKAIEAGLTPLMIAVHNGHEVNVQDLLAAGANPSRAANHGQSVLEMARAQGHSQVTKLLLDDMQARSKEELLQGVRQAVDIVRAQGHSRVVKAMAEGGLLFDDTTGRDHRFAIATQAPDGDLDELGVYGEFPLPAITEALNHPAARSKNSFVDFGSGAGRLLLGVAGMRDWVSVIGVEALEGLHAIASEAIAAAETAAAIRPGVVRSIHARGLPHESPMANALEACDVCFMY